MLTKLNPLVILSAFLLMIETPLVPITTVLAQDRAAVRIAGHVIDNNGNPLNRVKISMQGKVIGESGKDGSFSIAAPTPEPRIALTFASEGYVSNTRIYDASATRDGNVVIIWPVAYRLKFDPSRELDAELGGSRIKITANTLVGPRQERLSGPVELRFTLFDVSDRLQQMAASGDYSAQMPDGAIRRLTSYGIFDLGLSDLKGQPLNLIAGAKIDLAVPVPPRLAARAPKQVGFFDFDEKTGRWIPIGTFQYVPEKLTYNGSVVKFNVPHNLDSTQDTTCITIQVVNIYDGSPMPNFTATVHAQGYGSSGTTDSNGFVCLLVERNSTFTVDAMGSLGGNTWGTPHPSTFTAPNFSSGTADCGNCTTCPFVGTVQEDFLVGVGQIQRFMNGSR